MTAQDSRYLGEPTETIKGGLMHCKTIYPNSECPQLRAGCLGCTFRPPNLSGLTVSLILRRWSQGKRWDDETTR